LTSIALWKGVYLDDKLSMAKARPLLKNMYLGAPMDMILEYLWKAVLWKALFWHMI
jgi:hypothetical protein